MLMENNIEIKISSLLPSTEGKDKNIVFARGGDLEVLLIGQSYTLCKKVGKDNSTHYMVIRNFYYTKSNNIYHYDDVLHFEELYLALKRFYEKEFNILPEFTFKEKDEEDEEEKEFRNSDFYLEHFTQNF